jgi:hypothetical protein
MLHTINNNLIPKFLDKPETKTIFQLLREEWNGISCLCRQAGSLRRNDTIP